MSTIPSQRFTLSSTRPSQRLSGQHRAAQKLGFTETLWNDLTSYVALVGIIGIVAYLYVR